MQKLIEINGLYNTNSKDKYLKLISDAINELNSFFSILQNKVIFNFHKNRESFDKQSGKKTDNWVVGFHKENTNEINLIDPDFFEKLSVHKYSEENFTRLIKHELAHLYLNKVNYKYPPLFDEGFAIYFAGIYLEKEVKEKVKKFGFVPNFDSLLFFETDYFVYNLFSLFLKYLEEKYGISKLKLFLECLNKEKYNLAFKEVFKEDFVEEYEKSFLKWILKT